MNPADRRYSYSLDRAPELPDERRCELCGSSTSAEERPIHKTLEHVYRLSEWAVWSAMTNKAFGATVRVACAKLINPCASIAQLASVVGMTKPGVYVAVRRLRDAAPHIYFALWPEDSRRTPRQGTPQTPEGSRVNAPRKNPGESF